MVSVRDKDKLRTLNFSENVNKVGLMRGFQSECLLSRCRANES
jgi:hypothetical protein